ncbi:MAG TPA: hypothetical protein VLB85_09975 [Acidimicrobiia bacterium]|nr:hypothetical protein [Acidimicrobiia bacterium]
MTTPSAPAHPLTFTDARLRPPLPRRSGRARSHVVLEPLTPLADSGAAPVGYLARPPREFAGAGEELAWIRWTVTALGVLAPGAFLAASINGETLVSAQAQETLGGFGRHLMPILEPARVGRRLEELGKARVTARNLGMPCAIGGQRVRSAAGFDALVVEPARAAATIAMGGCPLLIATRLDTQADLDWARRQGANLIGGRAIAEPLRVAPVDVSRLQR